jgi:hypothetical protein
MAWSARQTAESRRPENPGGKEKDSFLGSFCLPATCPLLDGS